MRKNITNILLILIIMLILGVYGFYIYKNYYLQDSVDINIEENINETKEVKESNDFYVVEVKGAVENPGVYNIESSKRINDIIFLAGGFKSNAYIDNINLSKKVSDEMVIYVFTKYEFTINENKQKESLSNCKTSTYDISSCTINNESVIETGTDTYVDNNLQEQQNSLVNINTATIEQLTTLSGIGESKAKSIIAYRQEHGNFEKIEDIINVSGISENTYEKIKDYITV